MPVSLILKRITVRIPHKNFNHRAAGAMFAAPIFASTRLFW
jgi:hypothetical protein